MYDNSQVNYCYQFPMQVWEMRLCWTVYKKSATWEELSFALCLTHLSPNVYQFSLIVFFLSLPFARLIFPHMSSFPSTRRLSLMSFFITLIFSYNLSILKDILKPTGNWILSACGWQLQIDTGNINF